MTERMMVAGPSNGGRARVVMGDFKVDSGLERDVACFDPAAARDYGLMVDAAWSGVLEADPNAPSRARACTCMVHLTSSIGVLHTNTHNQSQSHLPMPPPPQALIPQGHAEHSQDETSKRPRHPSSHRQLAHTHLPPLPPRLLTQNPSLLGVNDDRASKDRMTRSRVVSNDLLDPVVDEEETGVFRCGAYDGCRDALWLQLRGVEFSHRVCDIWG